jgi:hypothetical protein
MRIAGLVFAMSVVAAPAFSGEIQELGDFSAECTFKFTGDVVPGDADKIAALNTYGSAGASLCLDSRGGSLPEGIKMFTTIWNSQMHTRVLSGDRCESACAIAWLGGSVSEGTLAIEVASRSIQPGAILGFHAPSLKLPRGSSYASEQVESAFRIALESAEGLFDIKLTTQDSVNALNDYLYARTLETPGSDMYRVDTVGEALMANIQVSAARAPETLTRANILALCENAYLMEQGVLVDPNSAEEEMIDAASHMRYLRKRTVTGDRVGYVNDAFWTVRMYDYRRNHYMCVISDNAFGDYLDQAKRYNSDDPYVNGRVYLPELSVNVTGFSSLHNKSADELWVALEKGLEAGGLGGGVSLPFYALYDAATPLADLQAH